MALPHAHSGQLIDIRPLGKQFHTAASKAILKSEHLELMRLVLPKGKSLPEHDVPGEVTMQCLEGSVELLAHGARQVMQAGEMVYLNGGVSHTLTALEDASVLVTILLKHGDLPRHQKS